MIAADVVELTREMIANGGCSTADAALAHGVDPDELGAALNGGDPYVGDPHPAEYAEPPTHDPHGGAAEQSDDSNARRLVDRYGGSIRRVSDMRAWWWWDGTRWTRDDDDAHVREYARALARLLPEEDSRAKSFKRNALSATGISGAVRLAESDPRIAVLAAQLDAHPYLLNTLSGVVDLRTGAVGRHDPTLMLTRITPVGADLNADHGLWDAFLAETFCGDDEMIGYLQRLFGLALIGEVREHVLPFWHGVGANGKGALALVAQALLGSADMGGYAVSAPDGFLMSGRDGKHETEIARLRGARLVVCAEQSSGRTFDEAKVKRLTGGDMLTGRFMRQDFFDFPPTHLVVVLSNHRPQVREGGPALWRRVRLIPFGYVVPEDRRDPELHTKLIAAEGPAILGWMVHGAMAVLDGGLATPKRVVAATEEYRIAEDTLVSFVGEECLIGPDWHVTVACSWPATRRTARSRVPTRYQRRRSRRGSPMSIRSSASGSVRPASAAIGAWVCSTRGWTDDRVRTDGQIRGSSTFPAYTRAYAR